MHAVISLRKWRGAIWLYYLIGQSGEPYFT